MHLYVNLLESNPIIVNVLTAFILTFVSSSISQKIVGDDIVYRISLMYGLSRVAIIILYIILVKRIQAYSVIQQILLEAVLFSVIGNFIFLNLYGFLLHVYCRKKYSYKKVMEKFPSIVSTSLKVWPIVNFIRIKYFHPRYRVFIGLIVSFFFNIHVSKMILETEIEH